MHSTLVAENMQDDNYGVGNSKKIKLLEDNMAAIRQKLLQMSNKNSANQESKLVDLEAVATNLKERLEKVE